MIMDNGFIFHVICCCTCCNVSCEGQNDYHNHCQVLKCISMLYEVPGFRAAQFLTMLWSYCIIILVLVLEYYSWCSEYYICARLNTLLILLLNHQHELPKVTLRLWGSKPRPSRTIPSTSTKYYQVLSKY